MKSGLTVSEWGLYRTHSKFTGRFIAGCWKKYGLIPAAETPPTPDETDVLDVGDVVEGLGGYDLATRLSRCGSRGAAFVTAWLK